MRRAGGSEGTALLPGGKRGEDDRAGSGGEEHPGQEEVQSRMLNLRAPRPCKGRATGLHCCARKQFGVASQEVPHRYCMIGGLPWWLIQKRVTLQCGRLGSIPDLGRSPGEGSILQYSGWRNSTVCGVTVGHDWGGLSLLQDGAILPAGMCPRGYRAGSQTVLILIFHTCLYSHLAKGAESHPGRHQQMNGLKKSWQVRLMPG